jgi:tRNA dimethylallyltransferase
MKTVVLLCGPTGTGKTQVALKLVDLLAQRGITLELINADSVAMVRGFDVGAAKPSHEELQEVSFHGLDLYSPNENPTAMDFRTWALATLDEIHSRGNRALLVGGSTFYLRALVFGMWEVPGTQTAWRESYDSMASETLYQELLKLDPNAGEYLLASDRYRVLRALEITVHTGKPWSALRREDARREADPRFAWYWIDREDPELEGRLAKRAKQMLDEGLLREVQGLLKSHPHSRTLKSVGYAQAVRHLKGLTPSGRKVRPGLEGLLDELTLAHRQLVKAQRTFLEREFARLEMSSAPPKLERVLLQTSLEEDLLFEKLLTIYDCTPSRAEGT